MGTQPPSRMPSFSAFSSLFSEPSFCPSSEFPLKKKKKPDTVTDTNNPLNMLILPPHTATPRGRSIPSDLSYRQWLQHKKNTNRFYKIHNSCSIIPIPILFKIFLQETSPLFIYFSIKLALLMTTLYFPILSPYPITLLPI